MARRSGICATLLIAALLASASARAADRRLTIVTEGEALGAWRPVAETIALPAYPGIVADKSEDACVSIGYLIKADGSTSDFAVLAAWSSKADGFTPTDPRFLPFSRNALAAVQRWRFETDGGAGARGRQVFSAATFAFSTTGADMGALKDRCRIADLKEFISKLRADASKRHIDRGRQEVNAPKAPPKSN